MEKTVRIAIASDIHYAGGLEQARGSDYEQRIISNRWLRLFVGIYRRHFWARDPLQCGYLLDDFVHEVKSDHAIICGDLTCDTGFVGVSDPASFASARECLARLRGRFEDRLRIVPGDHDLGKMSFFGRKGGMRLESFRKLQQDLRCPAFWRWDFGPYVLLGITSSLVAWPSFASEALENERSEWARASREHMRDISEAFESLSSGARVILFCHDPTALPYLARNEIVRRKLHQVEHTFIGHLHSKLILAKSKMLAGMPRIIFLGHTVSKLSAALREARHWRPFKIVLCPALAGIELLKDGGYYELTIETGAARPPFLSFNRIPRRSAAR